MEKEINELNEFETITAAELVKRNLSFPFADAIQELNLDELRPPRVFNHNADSQLLFKEIFLLAYEFNASKQFANRFLTQYICVESSKAFAAKYLDEGYLRIRLPLAYLESSQLSRYRFQKLKIEGEEKDQYGFRANSPIPIELRKELSLGDHFHRN